MDGESCIEITTTVPSLADAERLAAALVERRLAACVQIVSGVRSVYRWQGSVERADEYLLLVKTEAARFEAIERIFHELHPYETPELIAVEIAAASDAYSRWIREQVRSE